MSRGDGEAPKVPGAEIKLSPSERAVLDEIGRDLRGQGWADFITIERLVDDWRKLAESVDRYGLTVDDYTNDLTSRDGLELALAKCPEPLARRLRVLVDAADNEFRSRTLADDAGILGRFFRITVASGWWWKRKPAGGPLADYLARS